MPSPHLIFDFDGTLIDSSPAILATMAAVLQARGITPVRPLDRDLIGPPLPATLKTLTGLTDPRELEALAADFRQRYDSDGLYATQTYPGIPELLRELESAGLHLHLATNKRLRPTRLLLEHFGWLAWFDSVYCVDSRTPAFPDKGEMLLALLDDLALAARQCVYVGDTRHDQQAAAHADIPFVAVGWGYGVGAQAFGPGVAPIHSPQDLLQRVRG